MKGLCRKIRQLIRGARERSREIEFLGYESFSQETLRKSAMPESMQSRPAAMKKAA